MSAKKIIDNLYLGDRHSIPKDAKLVVSCAEEIYREQIQKNKIKDDNQEYLWTDYEHVYFNFKDYPILHELDVNVVIQALKIIDNNIKNKKIYVHCIWGVNRSASIVFMYLVAKGYINHDDFDSALEQFERIYPYINPNPGWFDFLLNEFPYSHLTSN
ncbi:dual specificity protein phosphatase family protein [Spiroplasma endosymbiont of Polydrusus pterygomalis]|uniref:dual specificity protein phosphatase family protein n=1 Tax=Spiroplasma endosymbiont of Polydrusus pterygomalis TaxID=3139327 RepID=UPI003CCB2185